MVRHGTGSSVSLPVPWSRHNIRRLGRYREQGDRIRLAGPIEVRKRKGRVRRGRDKLRESENGSILRDPSTHSRP